MAERDLYVWVKTEAQSKTSSKAVGSTGLSLSQSSFLGKPTTCTKNLRVTVNENFLGIFS